jgi:hypothetical protein
VEEDTLKVEENEDGTLSISWDKEDPKYAFMNDLTEAEITAIIEQSIKRMMDDDESLLDSDE